MKLKCGFEWHVQIDSGKLFCRCTPVMHEESDQDIEVTRLLRPSFGESGKIDVSAEFEGKNSKKIVYKTFYDSDCLVDMDEEPPHSPDKSALEVAFKMANALGSTIFKDLIFMRKVIVDGSNTAGFQRTAVVGLGGAFKTNEIKINISAICLEEDSARKDAESHEMSVYKLDRLGIPLVEISTDIIETDEAGAKQIALDFGRFTRLFKVRRGIGTIRQDVNLSIDGGSRVELKGFQNIREMDKAITNEANRQMVLISIIKEYGYLLQNLTDIESKNVADVFKNSDSNIIKNALSTGKYVLGIRLRGFVGLLGKELIPGKRFGTEISDYLKIKDGSSIIHSDELPAYGISENEKISIFSALGCDKNDGFLFSICDEKNADSIKNDVITRIRELLTAVPAEVRMVKDDNTSSFLRPLGGKDRMYVETDLPVIKVDSHILDRAEGYAGFNAETLKKEYGFNDDVLDLLIGVNKLDRAIAARKKFGLPVNIIITVLVDDYRYIRRKFSIELKEKDLEEVLQKISKGIISKDASRFIFEGLALGKAASVSDMINNFRLKKLDKKTLAREINKLIASSKLSRYDTLITNLRDKLGFSFDASEAYKIASELLKNG